MSAAADEPPAKRARKARVFFLGGADAEEAADAAAAGAAGGAGSQVVPKSPAVTKQLGSTQSEALRKLVEEAEQTRSAGAWTDEEVAALAAGIFKEVPQRSAPSAQLVRTWLKNHVAKPTAKPRTNAAQRKLLVAAVETGEFTSNDLDARLRPLLAQVKAAGTKVLKEADVRRKLRELEGARNAKLAAEAAAAAAAARPPAEQAAPLIDQAKKVAEAVMGALLTCCVPALALADALRRDARKRRRKLVAEVERLDAARLADEGFSDGDSSSGDESDSDDEAGAEQGQSRAILRREKRARQLEAAARVLLQKVKLTSAEYSRVLDEVNTNDDEAALEALRVVAQPAADTLSDCTDVLAALEAAASERRTAEQKAQASARARAPRTRRSKYTKPATAAETAQFVCKAELRTAGKDKLLAEWAGCDVIRFIMKPGELRGTITPTLAWGKPTDAELQPVVAAMEAMLAACRARLAAEAAAGGGAAPERRVDEESEQDD